MKTKEELVDQFDKFIQKQLPKEIIGDQKQKQYFLIMASTYLSGEMKDQELSEYIKEVVDDEKCKNQMVDFIKHLKASQTQQKIQKQDENGKPKKEEKSKIYDRMQQGGKPQKRVKPNQAKQKDTKEEKADKEVVEGQVKEEQNIQDQKKGLKKKLQKSGKQKCRFYPFCRNPQTCEFFHPTQKQEIKKFIQEVKKSDTREGQIKKIYKKILNKNQNKIDPLVKGDQLKKKLLLGYQVIQCTYFPNCKFGQGCLYLHEACNYKEKCTKIGCPYAHPFKKNNNIFEEMLKGIMKTSNPLIKPKKPKVPHKPKQEEKN